ncbi:hypothetical protein ANTPLA_LOCUS4581 [Anthophora plagiata]
MWWPMKTWEGKKRARKRGSITATCAAPLPVGKEAPYAPVPEHPRTLVKSRGESLCRLFSNDYSTNPDIVNIT